MTKDQGQKTASFLCGLAAFVLAGCFTARNLATWPARLRYPGEEAWEGTPLAEMVNLRQGVPIYAPPSAAGFADATYGPLYYLLGSRLVNPERPSYLPLRLLAAVGTLGCAAGCGLLAFWLTRSCLAAFLSPLVFLSYAIVTSHGTSALSDSVALFLFFSGFLIAYRLQASRGVFLAAPVMMIGFYYKPQYVAGPTAVFMFLLLEKRYRRAAGFAGLLGLGGLALLAFFQWVVFPEQAFWRHFLSYQGSLLSWYRFGHGLFIFPFLLLVPLLFTIEYLRTYPARIIASYLILAVLLELLTFSKRGSGLHYFLESILLVSSLVGATLAKRLARRAHAADVLLVLGLMLFTGQAFGKRPPAPEDLRTHEAVQLFLRHSFPAHAKSLSAAQGELVQAGFETPFSGLFLLTQLARRSVVSDRDVVARIQARWFSIIVLSFDLRKERDPYWLSFYLTESMCDAIEKNYQVAARLEMPTPERERPQDRFYIYVPGSGGKARPYN